jgi:hypothetical protein
MKKLIASLGLVMSACLCATPAAATIAVNFTPSSSHVAIGDSVVIDVGISGLGSEILSAYDLNFIYNPSILHAVGRSQLIGDLGNADGDWDPLVEGGAWAISYDDDDTLAANQADSFKLFSFTLEGAADGVTSFGLGFNLDDERNFVGLNFTSLAVNVGSACVAVGSGTCNSVPEPSSYALMAFALAGIYVARARLR